MDRTKTVVTIKKRLQALGCPFYNEENILADQVVVNVISWLEDQWIRLYDIPDREPLRRNDNNWTSAFNKYLTDLCCPCIGNGFCEDNKLQCLLWIVSHAISVEYEDNFEKFNAVPKDCELTNEDMELLQSFRMELLGIANFMNLSIVDSNDISSILDVIETELKSLQSQIVDHKMIPLPFSLDELPITMSTDNKKLHRAICVMECLYNEDIREIQDKINYIIEQVQTATANPLTDASLGVVGF